MDSEFKPYKKIRITYMHPVTKNDCLAWLLGNSISISDADIANGSPKEGDMIAVNPSNNLDKWLVAQQYFVDNYEATQE